MKQDREAVRVLAIQIGVREAARRLGLNEDRVCQWSKRYNWLQSQAPEQQKANVSTVSKAGDVLLDEIADNEKETRISLSRYARKASKDSENASLKDSPYVHKAAQVAGIAFKWDAKEREHSNVVVNIALLGIQPGEVTATATEVDSGVSE